MRTVHLALIDNSEDRDDRRRRDQARQDALLRFRRARDLPARPRQHRLRRRAQPGAARHRLGLPPGAQSRRRARARRARQRRALARRASPTSARSRRSRWAPTARASTCASAIRRSSTCSCAASRPAFMRALFRRRLDRYEMRDVMDVEPPRDVIGIPALSGAFMLVQARGDRQHRRLRPEVLPLLRGLRLERAPEPHHQDRVRAVGADRPPRRRRRAQGLASTSTGSCSSGLRFYRRHGWKWF